MFSVNVNKKYKDTVFVTFFSDVERLIELYNAIAGTHYDNSVPLTINTLSDVLFMDRKNDISFLLDNKLVVLIEHQSTINKNIPLRFLIYVARVYELIVDNKVMYQRKQIKLPQPEFIVLYNGVADYPAYSEIKLSDAFLDAGIVTPAIDLTVKVYNINKGQNPGLVQRSRNLDDYVTFVAKVREFQSELTGTPDDTLERAIKKAIYWCIDNSILKNFLKEHASEVVNMVFGEWDMDIALEVAKEEGIEIGIEIGETRGIEKGREESREEWHEKGLEEGLRLTATNLKKTGMSLRQIAEITGLPITELERL
jgi:predicted transposase YdaD